MKEKVDYETLWLDVVYFKEDIVTTSDFVDPSDSDELEWDWLGNTWQ